MKGLISSILCTKCGFNDFELTDLWEENNIEEVCEEVEKTLLERHREAHPECKGTTEIKHGEPGSIEPDGTVNWQNTLSPPDMDIDHEVVNL